MRDSTKKKIIIGLLIIGYILLLQITSDLDIFQTIITIGFGYLIYISSQSQKKQIIYIGASIGLLGTISFLVLGYFPLFQNTPNINIYTNMQNRKIIVQSKDSKSTLIIEQDGFSQKQEINNDSKEIFLKESQISTITFSNKTKQTKANINIQYPDHTTIYIQPNTKFTLQISGAQQIIEKISGNMEYIPGSGNKIIVKNAEAKKISDFVAKGLWEDYQEKERKNMIQQAGGEIMQNENLRKISHYILVGASKIWPNHYLPYLDNEQKYKQYFKRIDNPNTTYQNQEKELNQTIKEDFGVGQKKTMFLKYLDNNE